MLKAEQVILIDGETYDDVYVIPGDISLVVVLSHGETLDITRECIKLVRYSDPKSQWMIRTLSMGLLLETFEDVQETLLDLELQAEEVQEYIEQMHTETMEEEKPPQEQSSSPKASNPYE